MRVSLKEVKKYVDISNKINDEIAYDLTLKTVEVENVIDEKDKYNNIIVGKIVSVSDHPNADSLKVCQVDIGSEESVQIVCGGSNLYNNEYVVVSLPGSKVYWHGEKELVEIKETKMRGIDSYGMICAAEEVFLENFFPSKSDKEIVDLSSLDVKAGQNISSVIYFDDTTLEIDNKSLSNRPDLWGIYGISRELSVIYDLPLKKIKKYNIKCDNEYNVKILNPNKCYRYACVKIDNLYVKDSPLWMKSELIKAGFRPINALVDITNYTMIVTGQPMHAFDSSHIHNDTIVVRDAKDNEKLLLLDNESISLTSNDLVICDDEKVLALAGIRGGKNDSILDTTTSVLLEIASFDSKTIRKTDKRFSEKTDSAIRYEKGIDTQRVDDAINLSLSLIKDIYPESIISAFTDEYPVITLNEHISVSKEFLDKRMGKEIDSSIIISILERLGYVVKYNNEVYDVIVPTYRSTGDVSLKDDVMGDIVRILGFNSFEAKALEYSVNKPIIQNKYILERRIREYLSYRCGFNEIITYPWVNDKYIKPVMSTDNLVRLSTPPSPEESYLRGSLIPGMIEAISKNLRYYDKFNIYEINQVFENGSYSPSSSDEVLPVHKKYLTFSCVRKDAFDAFYELKGVLESISSYTHMYNFTFKENDKPLWADNKVHLDIYQNDVRVGTFGLLSYRVMNECKIKRVNVSICEIDLDKLVSFTSRDNKYEKLPLLPLIEKDLSVIVDNNVKWESIYRVIKSKVKSIEFIEEYHSDKIPDGKKAITFKLRIDSGDKSLTSEEINNKINTILKSLNAVCGAKLREE